MRIRRLTHKNTDIRSYNDSGVEWVVSSDKMSTQRFPMNKWTQKEAIDLYIRLMDNLS